MLDIEHRQLYRSNGLIDDFVVFGTPADYVAFAQLVERAIASNGKAASLTAEGIQLLVVAAAGQHELFTSLQNEEDFYPSLVDWNRRNILRVSGSDAVLERLRRFLMDVSTRGDGYSYISEYSSEFSYCVNSPQWRLQVQGT